MSSRRSNNNAAAWFVGIWLLVIVVVLISSARNQHKPTVERFPPSGPVAPSAQRPASEPAANPIAQMLALPPGVQPVDGIGMTILLDTSGSMNDTVRDADGAPRRKIEIARRCILDVVRSADAYYRKLPVVPFLLAQEDRRLLLGLYEFSARDTREDCRTILTLRAPDVEKARTALDQLRPDGSTPIGDAVIRAKRDLDATGLTRQHILVVTDGLNNRGYAPGDVVNAISQMDEAHRASVYFIAFDIAAENFRPVRDAGGLVLSASNERELQQTLDYVLSGKILVEQPVAPGKP